MDDEIPVQGGSHASSSHEAFLEPIFKRREDLGKHSVKTHLPKDRNCEICKRTKITRAPKLDCEIPSKSSLEGEEPHARTAVDQGNRSSQIAG